MNIHVICCNDCVEFAVVEDEVKAEQKLEELRKAYYEENKSHFGNDFDAYKRRIYWRIRTVSGA